MPTGDNNVKAGTLGKITITQPKPGTYVKTSTQAQMKGDLSFKLSLNKASKQAISKPVAFDSSQVHSILLDPSMLLHKTKIV